MIQWDWFFGRKKCQLLIAYYGLVEVKLNDKIILFLLDDAIKTVFLMHLDKWLICLTKIKLVARIIVVTIIAKNERFLQDKSWHRPVY